MYIWDSKQQAIAVVDAGGDECMDQRLCCVSCQVLSSLMLNKWKYGDLHILFMLDTMVIFSSNHTPRFL